MSNEIIFTASSEEHKPEIIIGRVDSFSLYEITEHELNLLEAGSPSSLYLNFSILFVTIAISFLISLLTTDITTDRVFIIFVLITIVGFVTSFILGTLWWKSRQSIKQVINDIRKRITRA